MGKAAVPRFQSSSSWTLGIFFVDREETTHLSMFLLMSSHWVIILNSHLQFAQRSSLLATFISSLQDLPQGLAPKISPNELPWIAANDLHTFLELCTSLFTLSSSRSLYFCRRSVFLVSRSPDYFFFYREKALLFISKIITLKWWEEELCERRLPAAQLMWGVML